jgi:hypothetical protein
MTFSAGFLNKQPADWIPTKLYAIWCEHHGPSNHATAECRSANGLNAKPMSEIKAEAAELRRNNRGLKEVATLSSSIT